MQTKVRGPVSPKRSLSVARAAALAAGDVEALLALNRAEFGGFRMLKDDDDDDDTDDDDDDDASGDDDTDDDKKDKSKKDKDASASDDDDDEPSELENMRKRMKAADKRAAETERELRELRDKDKPELDKVRSDLEEITAERDGLRTEVRDLRLQNAFLTANDHEWHDPDVALSLAGSKKYLEDVVDDDGEVDRKALKKALERLAKEHQYLIKSKSKDDKDDEPGAPSGEPAGGRSDNAKDEKAKQASLRRRFPSLNR